MCFYGMTIFGRLQYHSYNCQFVVCIAGVCLVGWWQGNCDRVGLNGHRVPPLVLFVATTGALVSMAPFAGQFSMCKSVLCFLLHEWHVRRFLHVLLRCPFVKQAKQNPCFFRNSIFSLCGSFDIASHLSIACSLLQ